jgi:integrase
VTFVDAAKRFLEEECPSKSLERAGIALDRVLPFIGDMHLDEIYDETLAPFKKARERNGVSAGTINKELGFIRRILTLAARKWRTNGIKWLDEAPLISMVDGKARKPYPLEWEEQRRLFAELPPHQARMALFAVNTGLRQGELVGLRWLWEVPVPELAASVFVLPEEATKNGDERVLVLNDIARRVLEEQRGQHSEFVFSYKGKPVQRLNTHAFREARRRAGVPDCRVHDLRHTFGHRLRAAGVLFEDRQDLLGHRSGRMTTHYSAPDLGRLLEAVNRICKQERATVLRLVRQKSGSLPGKKAVVDKVPRK